MKKVRKKIHFQSIWYIADSLCKIEKGSIHQFKAGSPVFPNRGRGSLHVSEIDFILICEKLNKSGLQPFQTEAATHPCHF